MAVKSVTKEARARPRAFRGSRGTKYQFKSKMFLALKRSDWSKLSEENPREVL